MSVQVTTAARNTMFTIGWIALLSLSALATIGHVLLGLAMPDEATLFLGWAAFTLMTTVVLYIPFRRVEAWAWYTSWTLVVVFAAPFFLSDESFTVYYLGAAILMAVSLLVTRPVFFPRGSGD